MIDITTFIGNLSATASLWLAAVYEQAPWLNDALVACFLTLAFILSRIGAAVTKKRREQLAAAIARDTLQTIIDITGPQGAEHICGRWNARSRLLEIVLTFPNGSVRMTGRLGVNPVAAAVAFLDHRPLDQPPEDEPPPAEEHVSATKAPTKKSWWEILGVQETATAQEVTIAYRRKAMEAHPDRGGTDQRMAEVNAAKEDWASHPRLQDL